MVSSLKTISSFVDLYPKILHLQIYVKKWSIASEHFSMVKLTLAEVSRKSFLTLLIF